MAGAFQANAFQNNAFQVGTVTPTPTPTTPTVGGVGKKRRRILRLKIGDEEFDVFDQAEAERILAQLQEAARETALAAAQKSVAKAVRAKTPAAKARALIADPPRIKIVAADRSAELYQLLQAKIDAAQAALEATYRLMLAEAYARFEQDEEDVVTLLLS